MGQECPSADVVVEGVLSLRVTETISLVFLSRPLVGASLDGLLTRARGLEGTPEGLGGVLRPCRQGSGVRPTTGSPVFLPGPVT